MPERLKFTASRVGSLPIQAKEYAAWDETTPGFGVRVYPSGQRRYVYRYRAGASRSAPARMVTIGDVRKLGLEDARRVARDLAGQVARGGDPSAEKRQSELDRVRKRRFADVRDEFLAKYADPRLRPRTATEYRRILTRLFEPLANMPFDEVSRADIADALHAISERGIRQANLARAVIRKMFSWARSVGLCDENPVRDTAPAGRDMRRERVLSMEELGLIYRAALEVDDPYGAAVRFLMLTGQRRAEVLEMPHSEIDLEERLWRLPAARTKNRRPHDVPLSPTALAILASRQYGRDLVFSTPHGTPFGALSKAKRRLDAKILELRRAEDPKAGPLPHWTLHDLRRSFVTHAHDQLGVDIPVIERAINHISGTFGGIVGVYNRAPLLKERRAAFDAWDRLLTHVAGLDSSLTEIAGRTPDRIAEAVS
ncbi:tyrosine-type recombinase/integrase [Microvirga lenta]|uniref:tyrosine-type recombinase/integrase n=1 Tax=Microvirga lenta TaxID=2881337 RepID=UPI001D00130C|nr:site-specific integrase [Microvirga lenta]MCB5176884.1 site-specific integrase [Microvirga lenta]